MDRIISIGATEFKIEIVRAEDVKTWATSVGAFTGSTAGLMPPAPIAGQAVLRVKDIFTTRDGSWEPSSGTPGSLPQWARDLYLKPWGHPDYFDDAGADHHILGGIYKPLLNQMEKTAKIHYFTWTDNGNHVDMQVKEKSGWANIVMSNKFDHTAGQRGAWAWYPRVGGVPADIVTGGGMPGMGWHVSFFATWTLETATVIDPPTDPDADEQLRKDVDSLMAWAGQMSSYYPQGPQYVKPS